MVRVSIDLFYPKYLCYTHIGDLVFLRIFGKQLLFLNSYEAVTDIMEKRSKACSSRPHSEMGEL